MSFASFAAVNAQNASDREKGHLTGSFETNSIYYRNDPAINALAPEDRIGSNNYLKLDYYRGKFSAGVQLEAYLPALYGYPTELGNSIYGEKGNFMARLTNYYVSWQDDSFSLTAGTFYDQFGSGLLFRAWEDRALGMNNALMGARFTYNYRDMVAFKAIWGMPRFGMEFSETQVRGADLSVSLSNIIGWENTSLAVEGSVLNRYWEVPSAVVESGGKDYSIGYSGRINMEHNGFSARLEYVDAGDKYFQNPVIGAANEYLVKRGNAQLVELGYNYRGLGINLAGRRLEWMSTPIIWGKASSANLMTYIPAMCTQYTYMLTTLHPFNPQVGQYIGGIEIPGEIGGQLDVFYNFRRGSKIGGRRGMKIHANFSTYYTLYGENTAKAGNLLYRDLSVDLEKQWTKKFKMVLLYSMQENNHSYGANKGTSLQNIVVADLLYKYTPRFSTRLELQYLTTHEDEKDWMAALLEVNFAPSWSIYASDMYNHGDTKQHYFNVGASYTKSRTRVALSYGRNRAGYVCSGGVCRFTPAFTGFNLQITTSF